MYITKEAVLERTGYEVDTVTLSRAQSVIEAFTGRPEAYVTESKDRDILATAVAFQAAYMTFNPDLLYEQMALKSMGQSESVMTFDTERDSPWIAPMAHIACQHLSWRKSRTVHTGPIFDRLPYRSSWETH